MARQPPRISKRFTTRGFAISDRSGMKFPYREMVIEPGTGYLVHYTESDGMYSIVNHPQNYIPGASDRATQRYPRPLASQTTSEDLTGLLQTESGLVLTTQDIIDLSP